MPLRLRDSGHARAQLHKLCAHLLQNVVYKTISAVALIGALFGGNLWIFCDFEDDPFLDSRNFSLDVVMVSITMFFLIDMTVCWLGQTWYPLSFFFFMDLIGTASMAFEISTLLGSAGKMKDMGAGVDPVIMRAARAAKLAARAGRLIKLTKLMAFCFSPQVHKDHEDYKEAKSMHANAISRKLTNVLSTRIALVTIVLVLSLPLFDIGGYPEEDYSMEMWAFRLEHKYAAAAKTAAQRAKDTGVTNGTTREFLEHVNKMRAFYKEKDYVPFEMQGFDERVVVDGITIYIPGQSTMQEPAPNRAQNVLRQKVESCELQRPGCSDASILFDLNGPGRLSAGMENGLILFVIVVMFVASWHVASTLDDMVVKPIDNMLNTLREYASNFLAGFGASTAFMNNDKDPTSSDTFDDDDSANPDEVDEIDLLTLIFKKLAKVTGIMTEKNVASAEELEQMTEEQKGVVVDLMGCDTPHMMGNVTLGRQASSGGLSQADEELMVDVKSSAFAGIAALVPTWELDFLVIPSDKMKAITLHVVFDTEVGFHATRQCTDFEVFKRFLTTVLDEYTSAPYHNAMHACDVTHTVYRVMMLAKCDQWLGAVEQFSLLTAALCHDLGHQGKTNQFLVETRHELALTFNDASVLENMHASKLFQIVGNKSQNVFAKLKAEDYKTARKVCIDTILHTDNAKHFDMIKDIKQAYELSSDTINTQCEVGAAMLVGAGFLQSEYITEVFQKNSKLFLDLFLHLSDVSNPLKPFGIARAWATRVIDEFLAQGDEEKSLGIPVGALNDRDTISRTGSQHGFITFLVSPLLFGAVDLMPQLYPLAIQMSYNLAEWNRLWLAEQTPRPDDEAIAKKQADIDRITDTAKKAEESLKKELEPAQRVNRIGSTSSASFLSFTGNG